MRSVPLTLRPAPASSVLSGTLASALLLTAGASSSPVHIAGIKTNSYEPLTLGGLKQCVGQMIDIPLVSRIIDEIYPKST